MPWALLSFLNDALYDALPYALVCLGVLFTAKFIRFPDLTCSGTFVLGGALAAISIVRLGWPLPIAMLLAVAGGIGGGLLTGVLAIGLRIDRLLAGILSAFTLYSLNLLLLTPTLSYQRHTTLFDSVQAWDRAIVTQGMNVSWHPFAIAMLVVTLWVSKVLIDHFLASEMGLALRALEDERAGDLVLLRQGLSPDRYRLLALAIGNGIVGLAGALVSFKEGAASAHRGFDILVTGLITLLVGQHIYRGAHSLAGHLQRLVAHRTGHHSRPAATLLARALTFRITTASILGAVVFISLLTLSQRVGIEPAYAKIALAGLVALCAADPTVLRSILRQLVPPSATRHGVDHKGVSRGTGVERALDVSSLSFRYPTADVPILDHLSFTVAPGEMVRLTGDNGSGKTTVLRLVAGFLDGVHGGRIAVGGADLTGAPRQRLQRVVYVDQDAHRSVVGLLTPLENMALADAGRRPLPWRPALSASRVVRLRALAVRSGFSLTALDRVADSLSGGQRQVVNLMTLLARGERPAVVLLDEPTNNLDTTNQEQCRAIISRLREEGIATVVVNHTELTGVIIDREIHLSAPSVHRCSSDGRAGRVTAWRLR